MHYEFEIIERPCVVRTGCIMQPHAWHEAFYETRASSASSDAIEEEQV